MPTAIPLRPATPALISSIAITGVVDLTGTSNIAGLFATICVTLPDWSMKRTSSGIGTFFMVCAIVLAEG